ncbi:MAG: LamG-like jellyroll fold domain-containing protein [Bacteroidota bacterium]
MKGAFINETDPKGKGEVLDPVIVPGKFGNAFKSNGDDILKLGKVGIFNRFHPFSIGVWINIPKDINKGVIFHKGNGDITYAFHGYYLNLRDGKAEFLMAHTWPYNEILKVTDLELPKEKWIQLTLTYSGSGRADGIKLYVDGKETSMVTEKDNLYKDILFKGKDQPGLQIGADWRGTGFKNGPGGRIGYI